MHILHPLTNFHCYIHRVVALHITFVDSMYLNYYGVVIREVLNYVQCCYPSCSISCVLQIIVAYCDHCHAAVDVITGSVPMEVDVMLSDVMPN